VGIIFGSVRFLLKKNQTEFLFFFYKKNRNRTETGSNRPVSVRFGFLGQKPVQTGLTRFFVLARFFFVRFGFFSFRLIKPKPNRTELVGFFKILIGLIGFFSRFGFFGYLFSSFLGFQHKAS
jgi:hypothetical protein